MQSPVLQFLGHLPRKEMSRKLDLTGMRFGKLAVVEEVGIRPGQGYLWRCRCDCGNIVIVQSGHLITGHTKSCTCIKAEKLSKLRHIHGHSHEPIYKIWNSMKQRCSNPNNHAWERYGGRGLTVSDDWKSFSNFYRDMGERPEGRTLDRINNDQGYSRENCRWATPLTQSHNRRPARPRRKKA